MPTPPSSPDLFHIVHISRLASIISTGQLLSDRKVVAQNLTGVQIGFQSIKSRRAIAALKSYPSIHVGDCVPFYFCPRSVMLYVIHKKNHQLTYQAGQDEIIHLRLDMHNCISWADKNNLKWVFTDSNAGNTYFTEYNNLVDLNKINWPAVNARTWGAPATKEGKQAEFLIEDHVDFNNVIEIGVYNGLTCTKVHSALRGTPYSPIVNIKINWYY